MGGPTLPYKEVVDLVQKTITVEVPDISVNHKIHLPSVGWEPLMVLVAIVGLFLMRRKQ